MPPTFFDPASPVIKHKDTETKVTFKAGANAAVAAKAEQDEYVREMKKQLEGLDAKLADLKTRAAKAEGQTRKDLEKKVNEAQVKRDVAVQKLDEVKDAAPDRWEKIKDGAWEIGQGRSRPRDAVQVNDVTEIISRFTMYMTMYMVEREICYL